MRFDYFYEEQSENYSFYKIPKMLMTEAFFEELSTDAKVLYGLLLDRVSLSKKNAWIDSSGRVYVYYTIENVKASLRCANTKACSLLKELEEFGLIERKKQGLCKPTIIYVKDFTGFRKAEDRTSENENSGPAEIGIPEDRKAEPNNTEKNNTEFIYTDPFLSEGEEERRTVRAYFMEQLQIDWMKETHPYETEMIDEMLELIVDTVCSKRQTIRIAGDDKPVNVVKSRFMKLNSEHFQFVLSGMKENTTLVRNIKQYLLAALYNAPLTISNYYSSLVNHDMATGKI